MFQFLLIIILTLLFIFSSPSSAQTTTTMTTTGVNNTTTIPPPPNTTMTNNSSNSSSPNSFFYGSGIDIQTNTSQYLDANKCMSLNSNLKHPDLKIEGADIKPPLCIPIPSMTMAGTAAADSTESLHGWYLVNGTRSMNRYPTGKQLDNCIATCHMSFRNGRSTTTTVIFMFGACYCYDQDFHDSGSADKAEGPANCCHDGKIYEDYMTSSKCLNNMYGNVYVTSFLCPLNASLCTSSSIAKDRCEITVTNADHDDHFDCCVPEGSLYQPSTFGMQIAQYVVVFICVLALFQVLYWILRKRREENDASEAERSRDRPRLLIVPTVASTNASTASAAENHPRTVTQAGTQDNHAVAAAKEIAALYPALTTADLEQLERGGLEVDCAICIDPLRNSKALKTPCDHRFHHSCLFQYLAHKLRDKVHHIVCPTCRAILVDASVNEEEQQQSPQQQQQSPSSTSASPPRRISPSSSPNENSRSSRSSNPLHAALLSDNNDNNFNGGTEMLQVSSVQAVQGVGRGSGTTNNTYINSQLTPRGAAALL